MAVIVVRDIVADQDLSLAREDLGDYIKVVVDVEQGILAIGGEWHADAEQVLLREGSKQKDLWGGGIDLTTGGVDYVSLINTRPNLNNSQIVSDESIRRKMLEVISRFMGKYVKTG